MKITYPKIHKQKTMKKTIPTGMESVLFFTPSQFKGKQILPKKCLIFGDTKFATKQQNKNKYHKTDSKYIIN